MVAQEVIAKLVPGGQRRLAHLSDGELLTNTRRLVGESNRVFAQLLLHLAEVEARGVHRTRACSSLYSYCIYELRFSEDAAARRVGAAKLVKRFPALFAAIESGELHLTGVLMLGPHLTLENHVEVLNRAKFRSKKELARLVRELSPLPRIPDLIEPLGPDRTPPTAPTWERFVTSLAPPVRELLPGERPRDWLGQSDGGGSTPSDPTAPAPAIPSAPAPASLPALAPTGSSVPKSANAPALAPAGSPVPQSANAPALAPGGSLAPQSANAPALAPGGSLAPKSANALALTPGGSLAPNSANALALTPGGSSVPQPANAPALAPANPSKLGLALGVSLQPMASLADERAALPANADATETERSCTRTLPLAPHFLNTPDPIAARQLLRTPDPIAAPQQFGLQFSTTEEHVQLIERAKALLAREAPRSLGELHFEAMKLFVAALEKRKFAVRCPSASRA